MWSAAELRRVGRLQRERIQRRWCMNRVFDDHDRGIARLVADSGSDAVALTSSLVAYFWHAHAHYRHHDGTLAYYPGQPSIYGARNDAIEGVTRLLPLWAAFSTSRYQDASLSGPMSHAVKQALVHGTNPGHVGYWGPIGHRSTLICEGADIALALWLARDTVWNDLDAAERRQVLAWLKQAVGKQTADNNWHLFVVLIDLVLTTLDPEHVFSSQDRLRRVQDFYVSDGCFKDGPNGQVDFYNAWGFQYLLFWVHEISDTLVGGHYVDSLAQFCSWFQYLFTRRGLPLFGRSLCYRFAACGPLLSCALVAPATVSPGVAVAAYLANWQYFAGQGGLRYGRPTQGVFGDDVRWLDPYSGPASSFWGTRSIVLFCYVSRHLDWRHVAVEPLPAERHNLDLPVAALAARIKTVTSRQESVVQFDHHQRQISEIVLSQPSVSDKLRQLVYATACRPAHNLQKAGLAQFSSTLDIYR